MTDLIFAAAILGDGDGREDEEGEGEGEKKGLCAFNSEHLDFVGKP